jgi:hypothetical protein
MALMILMGFMLNLLGWGFHSGTAKLADCTPIWAVSDDQNWNVPWCPQMREQAPANPNFWRRVRTSSWPTIVTGYPVPSLPSTLENILQFS